MFLEKNNDLIKELKIVFFSCALIYELLKLLLFYNDTAIILNFLADFKLVKGLFVDPCKHDFGSLVDRTFGGVDECVRT